MRADNLSATFAALADPTRRAILARLSRGEVTVGDLAAPFDLSLPTVSRHIKVLEEAGLLVRQTEAQWRRCRLEPGPLIEAAEWIHRYRAFWDGRLDALVRFVEGQFDPPRPPRRRKKA